MGYNITDVVKHLIFINIIMFLVTYLFMCEGCLIPFNRGVLALDFPLSKYFEPFQIVTHMFMHADPRHLLFNMLGLFFFGPMLEYLWGPKRFLFFYLFVGLGATLISVTEGFYIYSQIGNPNFPLGWGASGSIYGVLIAYAMLFPDKVIHLIIPPIPIKARYVALGYIAMDVFFGFSGISTGIGHFAHLGGALTAALLVWYWKSKGKGYSR